MLRRTLYSFLALTLTFAASAQAVAPNTNRSPYGVAGYDVVAYHTDGAAVAGRAEFATSYRGVTWLFASSAHRQLFERSPERYLPAYLGYCAYGVARDYLVRVDPNAWSIVDGRLYLNYSLAVRTKWLEDRPGYIAKANANWPHLSQ